MTTRRRVLVVDDEEDVLEVTRMGLEMGAGWEVFTARSGQEAIVLATQQKPDVILLDWMMPDMDGRATLQALKADSLTAAIPVILVTAKAQSPSEDAFGGVDVIALFAKPFRPLKLAAEIERVLGNG